MAAFSHRLGLTYTTDAGTVKTTTNTYTGDADVAVNIPIIASQTNYEIDTSWKYSTIKSCLLYCDTALTIKTNSSGSPTDTITLAAGVQKIYTNDGAVGTGTNFFTADVTKIYVTNSTTASNLTIRVLYDSTPA
jgi:hypothetical protein